MTSLSPMPPALLPSVALSKSERLTTCKHSRSKPKNRFVFLYRIFIFLQFIFLPSDACCFLPLVFFCLLSLFKELCYLTACRFYGLFFYTAFEKNQIFCAKYIDISYFSDIISNRRTRVLTVKQKDCQRSQAKGRATAKKSV